MMLGIMDDQPDYGVRFFDFEAQSIDLLHDSSRINSSRS